jgi:hypothetical protein
MTGLHPSLFSRLCMIGLALLSIWYFISSFRINEKEAFSWLSKGAWRRMGITRGILIAYALIFESLGHDHPLWRGWIA